MKLSTEQQEKYLQMQMISQQIKMTQQQLQNLGLQERQLYETLETLDQHTESKIGSEIFVSLAPGIFSRAELKENSILLINVGAGVAVEKDVLSTKKLITDQLEEVKKISVQLSTDLQQLAIEAHHLEHEMAGTKCEH